MSGIRAKNQEKRINRGSGESITRTPLGENKNALDVLDRSRVTNVASDVVDSFDATTNEITAAAHSVKRTDRLRFTSGTNSGLEVSVQSIGTNTILIAEDFDTAPSATDTFDILRPISQTLSSTGGVTAENTFIRDGSSQVVTEDTSTPANNRPLPVKLIGLNGNLEVTAQNLNIQSTHTGANPDSVQLGDGTNLAAVSAALDLQTEDTLGNALLTAIDADTGSIATDTTSIDGKTPSLGATVISSSVPVNIASDQTVPVSAVSLPLPLGAATEATLATIDTDTGVIAGDTTSINAKLASLGQKASAGSMPVVIASDQSSVPVNLSASLPAGTNNIGDADIASIIGTIDTNNSSSATLGSGAVFTGANTDVRNVSAIIISIFADQVSAGNGLSIEFSTDGTAFDQKLTQTILANDPEVIIHTANAQFFRIVYTNGGTGQGAFRLQTILHSVAPAIESRRLTTDLNDQSLGAISRSVLAGRKPDTTYANVESTASGNLKIAIEEFVVPLPTGTNTIGAVTIGGLAVVDLIDDLGDGAGILFVANDNIDDSAGTFLTIVASTAAEIKKIEIRSTAGGFVGLFTGPAASEVLLTTLGPGEDQMFEVGAITAATRLSLRRLDSATVPLTAGFITMNFLG